MAEKKDNKKGCFGCASLTMAVFILSAILFGYILREWESHDWKREETRAALLQRLGVYYDNLKGWITSTPPANTVNAEPDTEPEEIPANYALLGDEAYARARQAWFKANSAAGAERGRLKQAVVAELRTAVNCYETASKNASSDAVLQASLAEKLKTTRKALADWQKAR